NLFAEGGDQLLLGPLAHVGRADGIHRPLVGLPVRDERSDADDRVVDVLWELVSDCLANLHVGLADKSMAGGKPAEVGHSMQIPHDDARFHADRLLTTADAPVSRRSPATVTSFVTFSCHYEFPKQSFGTHYEVAAANVIVHSEFIDVCRAIPEV